MSHNSKRTPSVPLEDAGSSDSEVELREQRGHDTNGSRGSALIVKRISSGDPEFEGRPAPMANGDSLPICHHCGHDSRPGSMDRPSRHHRRRGSDLGIDFRTHRSCNDIKRRASDYVPSEKDRLAVAVTKGMELAPAIQPNPPRQPAPSAKVSKKASNNNEIFKLYIFRWTEMALRQALWHLGQKIGKYSSILMIIPLLLFVLSMIGIIVQRNQLGYEPPFSSLHVGLSANEQPNPYGIRFNHSNRIYDALYRMEETDFSIIMKTDKKRHSIIKENFVDDYFTLKSDIESMKVRHGSKLYTYATLCREACNEDVLSSILNSGSSVALTYPETFIVKPGQNNISKVFLGTTFGGVETDPDGAISSARSLCMYFKVKPNIEQSLLNQWDNQFQSDLGEREEIEDIELRWWSTGGFLSSVSAAFRTIYHCLGFSVLIGTILLIAICCSKDSYHSKPGLGLSIVIAIVLPVAGGLSLMIGTEQYLNTASFPAFFVTAAVGLLLLLSLHQSWTKYNSVAVHPTEKLSFTLSWDGPLAVSTCIAIIVTYGITAAATKLQYFRYICLLVDQSTFLLLVFTLLFFSVVLFLTGRREAAGVKWFKFWQKGDTHFPLPMVKKYEEKDLEALHSKLCDVEPNFARSLGTNVSRIHFRFMALLFFSIYLIFAIWGCSTTPISLQEDQFLSDNSQPQKFLDDYRQYYGKYQEYIELVFEDILDYMNPKTRKSIFRLLEWAQEEQYATRIESWLRDFTHFEQSSIYLINDDTFVPVVHLVFLHTDSYQQYSADIAFDKYQSQIVRSRMYLQLGHYGMAKRLDLIRGLMVIAQEEELPLRIRAPFIFLLEHDIGLQSIMIIGFTLVICLLSCLGLLLLAQPFVPLLSLCTCLSVALGTIGYAGLWSVPLNAVNAGAVMLGLGYTAAVCYQFCHHFTNSGNQRTASQRMEYAFQSCLLPAFASAFVPVICFLPLLASGTPMVHHLAKLLFLQMTLTFGHLLLFLPPCVLLFTEHMPKLCGNLKLFCDDTCCACCDIEEDADSIYYIPTSGKSLDPDTLRRFFNSRYGSEGISVVDQYALPPPPRREMLLPPPNSGYEPDLIGSEAGRRRSYYQRSDTSGLEGSVRSGYTPPECYTPRRSRSVSPDRRTQRTQDASTPQLASPVSARRSFAAQVDDGRSVEESIYEEPPASVGESGSMYAVDQPPNGEVKMMAENRARARVQRHMSPPARRHYRPPRDEYYPDRPLPPYDDAQMQDLRPNWKQYLLDGAVRQGPMMAPVMAAPVMMGPGPGLAVPMPGPMRPPPMGRPIRGLHRMH